LPFLIEIPIDLKVSKPVHHHNEIEEDWRYLSQDPGRIWNRPCLTLIFPFVCQIS